MVKTSPSIVGDTGLSPGWGAKIPHALQLKNQNMKQKQHCNSFKMVHIKNIYNKKKDSFSAILNVLDIFFYQFLFFFRYLVDSRWFKQWKKYVGFDSWDKYQMGDQNVYPGPIDNSGLLRGIISLNQVGKCVHFNMLWSTYIMWKMLM